MFLRVGQRPKMKTYKEFIKEAYPREERREHSTKQKPVTFQTITRNVKDPIPDMNFRYRQVLPKKNVYHNTPILPTGKPKEKKPVWKNKEFQYPGMPIKDLLGGGVEL